MRHLYCGNEIIGSIKTHNLIQLKLFYNMLYWEREEQIKTNEINEGVMVELYTLKKILGRRYSENEIEELIHSLPKEIELCGKLKGFISIYDYVVYNPSYKLLEYRFNHTFMEYADINFMGFSILELNEFARLRSRYSQRLYELYKHYEKLSNYNMRVETLYKYFNIPGTTNISEVARIGLNPAIKELDEKLGIKVRYDKTKKGNEITHLHFKFEPQKNAG